jgi:hypothetical protein
VAGALGGVVTGALGGEVASGSFPVPLSGRSVVAIAGGLGVFVVADGVVEGGAYVTVELGGGLAGGE